MAVYFAFSPGGAGSPVMEFATNLSVVESEFRLRSTTGKGTVYPASEIKGPNYSEMRRVATPHEWHRANRQSRMWIWRRKVSDPAPDLATLPDEVWRMDWSSRTIQREGWSDLEASERAASLALDVVTLERLRFLAASRGLRTRDIVASFIAKEFHNEGNDQSG